MGVESAADLAAFFNADEHGAAAVWSLAAGGDTALSVIMSRPYDAVEVGGVAVQMDQPVALLPAADLPAGHARGDVLTIEHPPGVYVAWTVGPIDLDDDRAIARVMLRAV